MFVITRGILRPVLAACAAFGAMAFSGACADPASSGQTTVVLSARHPSGQPAIGAVLETTQEILLRRLQAAGFVNPVLTSTDSEITITVSGVHESDDFRGIVASGAVRFRKVLGVTVPQTAEDGGVAPGPPVWPTLAEVRSKLGAVYEAADAIDVATVAITGVSVTSAELDAFAGLSPYEVAVLPYGIQFAVGQITCEMLDARPIGAIEDPTQRAVACDEGYKYLLDVAKVLDSDIADAQAGDDGFGLGLGKVDLTFSASGAGKWEALTGEAYRNDGESMLSGPGVTGIPANPACAATELSSVDGSAVCRVAIVLDNQIVSAPWVERASAPAAIVGQFNEADARILANQLRSDPLPVVLEFVAVDSVA